MQPPLPYATPPDPHAPACLPPLLASTVVAPLYAVLFSVIIIVHLLEPNLRPDLPYILAGGAVTLAALTISILCFVRLIRTLRRRSPLPRWAHYTHIAAELITWFYLPVLCLALRLNTDWSRSEDTTDAILVFILYLPLPLTTTLSRIFTPPSTLSSR